MRNLRSRVKLIEGGHKDQPAVLPFIEFRWVIVETLRGTDTIGILYREIQSISSLPVPV